MYVEKSLVFFNKKFSTQNELFDFIADELEEMNFVTEDFREAIKLREQSFPTGIQLSNMNLAIVHTEASYSKTDKLVVLKLQEPLLFKDIVTLEPLQVNFVIGIVLQDSKKHLEVLQKVSDFLQNEEMIQVIQQVSNQDELTKIIKGHFNQKGEVL